MVAGFAAEACGVERRHMKGFKHNGVQFKKIKSTDIMMHYKNLKGKMEIYESGKLKFDILNQTTSGALSPKSELIYFLFVMIMALDCKLSMVII